MKFYKLVAGVLASFAIAATGSAAVVYENGSLNGNFRADAIDPAQAVSNSFTLSSTWRLTGATAGLWTETGSAPVLLSWSIGSSAFASDLAGGTIAPSNVFAFKNVYLFDIYLSSFGVDVTLGAGQYWLTLTGGASSAGGPLYWDANGGPSEAQFRNLGTGGLDYSHYFLIAGDAATDPGPGPSPVPEPASMALLAVGMIGAAAARRRSARAA